MKDILCASCLPVLLGSSKVSFRLSFELFAHCGLYSLLLDEKKSFFTVISPFSKYIPVLKSNHFLAMSLRRIAVENPDMTLLLTPCTDEYKRFVFGEKEKLEQNYIIVSPKKVCNLKKLKLNLQ